jgi:homoserine kinase type II
VATDEQIRSLVQVRWHRTVEHCAPLSDNGWRLTSGADRLLATLTPAVHDAQLLAALTVAEHLASLGFPVAAPVRAADGAFAAVVGDRLLTVVHAVPGRALDPADPLDQQWWGDLLGTAHRSLADFRNPRVRRLVWLTPAGAHLSVAEWVAPAVVSAVTAATRLTVTDRLTYGVLHGDPAPEAFRIDPDTGRTGLVDWRAPAIGPLAYDLAVAVGYAGGPGAAGELIDGYVAAGPLTREEAEAAMPVLLRYWLAERMDRLARRIAGADTAHAGHDWAALDAARAVIEELDKAD